MHRQLRQLGPFLALFAAVLLLACSLQAQVTLSTAGSYQTADADLTTYAGITPSANIQSLLGSADYAAARTNLGLAISTNVQAYDADLTTYAGITPSANIQSLLGCADYSAARTALGLAIGTNVQAYDANIKTTRTGVYRTIWVDAGAMQTRTTTGAALVTTEASTNKEMSDSFDFDTGADEFVNFRMALPDEWNLSTVKVKFFWTAASGSGTVKWYIQGIALSNDDAIDTAFGTAVGVEDTLITALDVHVTAATGAVTVGGTPALGDVIWWQIYRDVSEDTLEVDAKLIGIEIQYLESATEPAAW